MHKCFFSNDNTPPAGETERQNLSKDLDKILSIHRKWYTDDWRSMGVSRTTSTIYPKKYAHGFCFAVLCCGYTLIDFPISIRLTSLALWQSNDCPSASKATLMNIDKYFMWIHYERLHNHKKAKHNKTVCIFLGIYCISSYRHTALARLFHSPRTKHWLGSALHECFLFFIKLI